MANIQVMKDHTIIRNDDFIAKAEQLKPELIRTEVHPVHLIDVVSDASVVHGWRANILESAEGLSVKSFGKGDQFILDFGTHLVGYLDDIHIRPVGSPPDAPLHLRITFGEMPIEMAEPFSSYEGWISSSWLQEAVFYVDVLPGVISLPRRYSFRYVKFEVIAASQKYRVSFDKIVCRTVTSADISKVTPLEHSDELIQKMDEVSIKTLQDCMQIVFEDGPKRDRRLWLGDLRLQALANYETFKNNELVKRNLYLFAGLPNDKGQITANVFTFADLIADDTYLLDYSILFVNTLYDYYAATQDLETLTELWPSALRQIEIAFDYLDERHLVRDSNTWYSFIDWNQELNKQASTQGVLIYALRRAIQIAEIVGSDTVLRLKQQLDLIVDSAKEHLWDEALGFFISGADRQVSWASQIWMVLAEVWEPQRNKELLNHLLEVKPAVGVTTPYLYHHLVEALILSGDKEVAIDQMKGYWGEMINDGADTFWELYDPTNKSFSPYGNPMINSYCHAWSCTPTYLIRKYHL
ncbi:sugar hydrolase [Paenibacillus sinopodophylli]|uniref:alpha-L-rhamnosidase-related protein n=1 Tax=Paenibacillus sinopodophylli TaxID=1837342 RepID=UPI001FE4E69C|nr:sugar hydrolase [Paenibacillus sinopodophylli]